MARRTDMPILSRRDLLTGAAALAAYAQLGRAQGRSRVPVPLGRAGKPLPTWYTAATAIAGLPPDVAIGLNGSQLVAYSAGLPVPLSSLLSVTRAQTVPSYSINADGTWTAWAANTLRYGIGVGALIEPARTNLIVQSGDVSNAAAWSTAVTGSGTINVTGSQGNTPDGGPAALVSLNRSSTSDNAQLFQKFTGTAAGYSGAFWIKANDNASIGKAVTVGLYNGTTPTKTRIILTGIWQPAFQSNTTMAASANCELFIGYVGGDNASVGAINMQVGCASVELGAGVTSYTPTGASPVTRNADVILLAGSLLTAYESAAVTQVSRVMNLASAIAGARLGASFNATAGATPAFAASATTLNSYTGSVLGTAATIGNGVSFLNGPVNVVASFVSGAGTTAVANGGTERSSAIVMPAVTSGWLGGDGSIGSNGSYLSGYLNRLMVWKSQLSAPIRLALSQTFNTTSVAIGGQNTNYLVPTEAPSGTWVDYFHGAGEVETSWTTDTLKIGIREALLALGHLLSASAAAGDNWGNAAGQAAYVAQYADAISRFSISKTVGFSQSMGGLCGLLAIANSPAGAAVPLRGWYGIFPACNLAEEYSLSFTAAINTAYNIPGGGTYAAQTEGHDPVLLTGNPYALRMRFTGSASDVTVPVAQNAVQMQTLVSPFALESYLLNTIGVHGDASNFIVGPTPGQCDMANFIGRC